MKPLANLRASIPKSAPPIDRSAAHVETGSTVTSKPLFISVIIAARNEAENIGSCIESVYRCDHPRDCIEIIVVDHASTDATKTLARTAGATVVELHSGRIGKARNTGLQAAKGEYAAFVDADCIVPLTWLASAIRLLERNPSIGAVGGPYLSPNSGTWIEIGLAPRQTIPGAVKSTMALATGSFIARASLLRKIGSFDESLISGEDDDICNRIREHGLSILWVSDCHVVHRGYPKTWLSLVKKEIWHGSNHLEVRSGIDLTLLLTIMFIAAVAATGVLILISLIRPVPATANALALCVLIQLTPPTLYALKRVKQWPGDWYLLPIFAIVGYAYFLGHGIGVLGNGWRKIWRRRPH